MNMFGWISLHTPINWKERAHSKEKLLDMIIIPRAFWGGTGVEYRWEPDDDHIRLFRSPSWYLTSPTGRSAQSCLRRRAWTPTAASALWSLLTAVGAPSGGDGSWGWGKKEIIRPFFSTYVADYLVELLEIQIAIVVGVQTAERQNIKKTREQFTKNEEVHKLKALDLFW